MEAGLHQKSAPCERMHRGGMGKTLGEAREEATVKDLPGSFKYSARQRGCPDNAAGHGRSPQQQELIAKAKERKRAKYAERRAIMKRPCRQGVDRDEIYKECKDEETGKYHDKKMERQMEKRGKARKEGYLTIQIRAEGQSEQDTNPRMEVVLRIEKKEFTMT